LPVLAGGEVEDGRIAGRIRPLDDDDLPRGRLHARHAQEEHTEQHRNAHEGRTSPQERQVPH
jgi:hypothetical protein